MMKGYVNTMYELSCDPIDGECVYWFLGFMVLSTPIMAPLYYLGKLAEWVVE